MIVSDHVIIDKKIARRGEAILKRIRKDKEPPFRSWYVVTTAGDSSNIMYILSKKEYLLSFYRDMPLRVLGLAGSKKAAKKIVVDIIQKGIEEDALLDMRAYVESF